MCINLFYVCKSMLFRDLIPHIMVHIWVCDITFHKCTGNIHRLKNLRSHVVLKCLSKMNLPSLSHRRHFLKKCCLSACTLHRKQVMGDLCKKQEAVTSKIGHKLDKGQ